MIKEKSNRIFGFDILRSAAILIVVFEHSKYLISDYFKAILSTKLPDGVDLFFVLSGYLIGTILIKKVEENEKFNLKIFLHFMQRRWFRTLPNYYLFLFINIILIYFGLIKGTLNQYLVTYFVFFQNIIKPFDFLYWESWSLAVEEWFYLIFPLMLFVSFKIKENKPSSKKIMLVSIVLFLVLPLIFRLFQANSGLDWDIYFRKMVLTRLDTIGFGILAAFIHWYYIDFWNKSKNSFFLFGLIFLFFLQVIDFQNVFFRKTVYFSFIGLSVAMLLPKLSSFKNETIPYKPFQFLSKISYSMYLIHIPLLQVVFHESTHKGYFEALLTYLLFWLVTIVLSAFVYFLFEKPFTDLRDKYQIT